MEALSAYRNGHMDHPRSETDSAGSTLEARRHVAWGPSKIDIGFYLYLWFKVVGYWRLCDMRPSRKGIDYDFWLHLLFDRSHTASDNWALQNGTESIEIESVFSNPRLSTRLSNRFQCSKGGRQWFHIGVKKIWTKWANFWRWF